MLTPPTSLSGHPPLSDGCQFLQLCKTVRSRLPAERYRHVLGVARTAERLARRYRVSRAGARVAGMLHDIARSWPPEELLAYAREHRLHVSEEEQNYPVLLHARIGADIATRQFGVMDSDILAAIAHHTVAVSDMSDLEKIIYIADSIEPSRKFAQRPALEAAACRSLDEGMLACVKTSLDYLIARGAPIAPRTIDLYNRLVRRGKTAS